MAQRYWQLITMPPWHRLNSYCLMATILFISGWLYHAWAPANNPLTKAHLALQSQIAHWMHRIPAYDLIPMDGRPTGILYENTKQIDGFILFSEAQTLSAKLIDKQGKLVHRWSLKPQDLKNCQSCQDPSQMRAMHVFANGDLLALITNRNATPWGGPLVKIDAQSHIQWLFDAHCHHSFALNGKGHIYILTQHFTQQPPNPNDPLNSLSTHYAQGLPYLADQITLLNPNGQVLQTYSILEALATTPFRHIGQLLERRGQLPQTEERHYDPLHINHIQYIDAKKAQSHPNLKTGDLLLTARNLNALLVLRPSTQRIVHIITGPWHLPHHGTLLDNGHIAIFDNRSQWPQSRALIYDALTEHIIHAFDFDKQHPDIAPLQSPYRGALTAMPNQHWLITDSHTGRLLEIDEKQQLVWAYQTPTRLRFDDKWYHPILDHGQWLAKTHLPFLAKLTKTMKKTNVAMYG